MRKNIFSRDVHVETSFLLNMTRSRDCHVASLLTMIMVGLFSFNVQAECTPTPDCASIGYTETSCEGDSLKCPFDITKLFCVPCDSSFKYDCTGDNIVGGTGSACGGKYVSCECSSVAIFANGECLQQNCTIGMIYYSDKSCSANYDSAKTAVGIVVKDNELIMSQRIEAIAWGGYGANISALSDFTEEQAKEDFNGKDNTSKIVAHFGENVDTTKHAGVFCYKYSTEGTNTGDWYLPAVGELYDYVYGNYELLEIATNKLGWTFGGYYYWSSSENDSNKAWEVVSYSGNLVSYAKNDITSLICFRKIN